MLSSRPQMGQQGEMSATDVVELYAALQHLGVCIWVDGGWGVDALLGKQTRPHKDLDIAIQEQDVPKLRQLLGEWEFREVKLDIARPHNFVLGDAQGHEVDVHVIVLDGSGNGIYGPAHNGQMYPAASLTGIGSIEGKQVRCVSAEWAIRFHRGYQLKDKDLRDVSALCERFGIERPDEYKQMLNRESSRGGRTESARPHKHE